LEAPRLELGISPPLVTFNLSLLHLSISDFKGAISRV